ncbi:hypothetical protein C8J57DRAFT_1599283 [Mycena rebaudengoi]|nr:hypothetical protein C8J57DRAFT_1599283 [Mycena rebaudengoi]
MKAALGSLPILPATPHAPALITLAAAYLANPTNPHAYFVLLFASNRSFAHTPGLHLLARLSAALRLALSERTTRQHISVFAQEPLEPPSGFRALRTAKKPPRGSSGFCANSLLQHASRHGQSGLNGPTIHDNAEDERAQYVLIDKDIVPNLATRRKLRAAAWRLCAVRHPCKPGGAHPARLPHPAARTAEFAALPIRSLLLVRPRTHNLRPSSCTLHTAPLAALLALIIPLADPSATNTYTHLGAC